MKYVKNLLLPVFVIITIGFFSSPVSGEICNRVVALVNDDIITLYELNKRINRLTGFKPVSLKMQDQNNFIQTRRKILDLLIDEKLTKDKIQELGITVTPKEVDNAIEMVKKNNSLTHEDLVAALKKQGIDYESYRRNLKTELERMRLINFEVKSNIIIREEEIIAYYNAHKNKFNTEEQVRLAIIFLKQNLPSDQEKKPLIDKAKEIINRINNGEDFGELAKKISQGPGALDGGDLGFFKISRLDSQLRKVVSNLSEGEISDPIIMPSGIQIVKVVEKQKKKAKLDADSRDAIYRILYKEEVNRRYSSWIKELKEKSYTKIIF